MIALRIAVAVQPGEFRGSKPDRDLVIAGFLFRDAPQVVDASPGADGGVEKTPFASRCHMPLTQLASPRRMMSHWPLSQSPPPIGYLQLACRPSLKE